MIGYRATLAENAAAGTSDAKPWPGGKGTLTAKATWGGGSAKLQMELPDGTYGDVTGAALTADGTVNFEIPAGNIKTVMATGSAFYVWAIRLP